MCRLVRLTGWLEPARDIGSRLCRVTRVLSLAFVVTLHEERRSTTCVCVDLHRSLAASPGLLRAIATTHCCRPLEG